MLVERKKAAVKRCEEQLLKMEVQATDREENKQIALGTSKLNYLDPRISVAWWVNTKHEHSEQPWCLVENAYTYSPLNSCICEPTREHTQTWVSGPPPPGVCLRKQDYWVSQLILGLTWAFQYHEAGSLLISVSHHSNLSFMAIQAGQLKMRKQPTHWRTTRSETTESSVLQGPKMDIKVQYYNNDDNNKDKAMCLQIITLTSLSMIP